MSRDYNDCKDYEGYVAPSEQAIAVPKIKVKGYLHHFFPYIDLSFLLKKIDNIEMDAYNLRLDGNTLQLLNDNGDVISEVDISTGTVGPVGPQGNTGLPGAMGPQGLRGEKGDKGDPGEKGETGAVGPKGDSGEKGEKGDKGDTGETGPMGPRGDAFTYNDFTPEQLAALVGPAGSPGTDGADGSPGADGERGSKIFLYWNYQMTEEQARTELYTNHLIQGQYVRNNIGNVTLATDVLVGDWVINGKLNRLVRIISCDNPSVPVAARTYRTDNDNIYSLPSGPQGEPGTITAWRVTSYWVGMSPNMQQNPPASQVNDCFWLDTYYGPNNVTPKYGDFFYTAVSNSVTTLGIISGMGNNGYDPDDYPFVYFTDCTQLTTAQGTPGASVYHVNANFTVDNTEREFSQTVCPRAPLVGDVVYNADNSCIANIVRVDNSSVNTFIVDNVRSAIIQGPVGPMGPRGYNGVDGNPGARGATGMTPDISILAGVTNTTGVPAVSVTKSGTAENPLFHLAFSGLKGVDGVIHNFWNAPNVDLVNATTINRSSLSGATSNTYAVTGDIVYSRDKYIAILGQVNNDVFTILYKINLKGDRGEKGEKGDRGERGPAGALNPQFYYTKDEVDELFSRYTGGGREVLWQGHKLLHLKMTQIDEDGLASGGVHEADSPMFLSDSVDLPVINKPGYANRKVLVSLNGFVVYGKVNIKETLTEETYFDKYYNLVYGYVNLDHYTWYHDGICLTSYTDTLQDLGNNNVGMTLQVPCTCMLDSYDSTLPSVLDNRKFAEADIVVQYTITLI